MHEVVPQESGACQQHGWDAGWRVLSGLAVSRGRVSWWPPAAAPDLGVGGPDETRRLSGTGSSGATIRMYVEQYTNDKARLKNDAQKELAEIIKVCGFHTYCVRYWHCPRAHNLHLSSSAMMHSGLCCWH